LNLIYFLKTLFNLNGCLINNYANSLSIFVEAHNLIISHGFKKMNLRRVLSTTISKELDDLLCKILNFKKEGLIKKKVYKNNKYHDLYISSILK